MTAPLLSLAPQNGDAAPTTPAQGTPTDPGAAGPTGATDPEPGSPFSGLAPILIVVVIFWVIVILPQGKERKRRAAMLAALAKDDNVMTTGGMYGRVAKIDGDVVTLVVADGVRMRFHRQAIQTVLEDERSTDEAPRDTGSPPGS